MQDNFYEHHGLSVDLYRISKVRVRDLCEASELEYIKYIKRRKELGVMDKKEYKRRIEFLGVLDQRFWAYASETETLETIDREIITNFYTSRLKIELTEFLPLKKYKFEDTYFWGPRDAEAVLKKFYGIKFMELPPVKDRKRHYSSVTYLK